MWSIILIQSYGYREPGSFSKPSCFSEKKVQYLYCKFEASRRNLNNWILRQKCSNQREIKWCEHSFDLVDGVILLCLLGILAALCSFPWKNSMQYWIRSMKIPWEKLTIVYDVGFYLFFLICILACTLLLFI